MTSFYQEPLGGQPSCKRCGDREAVDAPLSDAGQRGWCWTCTRQYFDAETADFPGNRGVVLPAGQITDRRVQKAIQDRHKADVRRWLKANLASLEWRIYSSEQWFDRPGAARVLALVAVPGSGIPISLLRCSWLYQSSPALKDHPHAIVRWLVWEPGMPGYLEGIYDPVEGVDWCPRRLMPGAVRDHDRLRSLVIPEAGNPRDRVDLLDAVLALRADLQPVNRSTVGARFFITAWGFDRKVRRAGLGNLRGLLEFVDSVQKVQSRG